MPNSFERPLDMSLFEYEYDSASDPIPDRPISPQSFLMHSREHRDVKVGVVVDEDFGLCEWRRWRRPTYWASVPRQEMGMARKRVSKRESSNPSPR
jgi:hypothetical protein